MQPIVGGRREETPDAVPHPTLAVGPGGDRGHHRNHRRRLRQQHDSSAPSPRAASAADPRPPPAPPPTPRTGAGHDPVGVLRPGATQEAVDALYLQISEFEAKYPWITVEPEEYNWTAPTFTAALAAGTLPDVFTIPFTDGKGLIAQHQIVTSTPGSARSAMPTSSTPTCSSTARTRTARSAPCRPRPTACR